MTSEEITFGGLSWRALGSFTHLGCLELRFCLRWFRLQVVLSGPWDEDDFGGLLWLDQHQQRFGFGGFVPGQALIEESDHRICDRAYTPLLNKIHEKTGLAELEEKFIGLLVAMEAQVALDVEDFVEGVELVFFDLALILLVGAYL